MGKQNLIKNNNNESSFFEKPWGSLLGFLYTLILGFVLYFALKLSPHAYNLLNYDVVVTKAGEGDLIYKFIWMIMDFTQPQFYGGFIASLGVILGGFVAWRLSVSKSKYQGFEVCYGSARMWPWVFASQIISVGIAIFVLNFTRFFADGLYSSLPTFISIVAVPPSLMLIWGPNYKNLFTFSILGALLSFPVAFWIIDTINSVIELPGVVGSVLTMAITGIIAGQIVKVLPWIEKVSVQAIEKNKILLSVEEKYKLMSKPSWFVRRVLADFSEAQFYGNEIAGVFVLLAVSIEWFLNSNLLTSGIMFLPEIILSQFIGSAVGVLLYFNKFLKDGWYATYVPVVSSGPACVILFGGSIQVAIIAGLLGGLLGAPIAEYFAQKLPNHIHGTVANVTSMAITTIVVAGIISVLPIMGV